MSIERDHLRDKSIYSSFEDSTPYKPCIYKSCYNILFMHVCILDFNNIIIFITHHNSN